jgi:hypothetical protein
MSRRIVPEVARAGLLYLLSGKESMPLTSCLCEPANGLRDELQEGKKGMAIPLGGRDLTHRSLIDTCGYMTIMVAISFEGETILVPGGSLRVGAIRRSRG